MRGAAQSRELLPRHRTVRRLGKPPLTDRERLVGAEHHAVGMLRRNRPRLLARKQRRDHSGALRAGPRFDAALVDIGGLDLDRDAGGFQHGAARGAF